MDTKKFVKLMSIDDIMSDADYRDDISTYVRAHDLNLADIGLSTRAARLLAENGYKLMSQIVFMTKSDLLKIYDLGLSTANEITERINRYISGNEAKIRAFIDKDSHAEPDEDNIKDEILDVFKKLGFTGANVSEIKEKLPVEVPQDMIKRALGRLIADGKIEYVDYRCHKIYGKFKDYISICDSIGEREKDLILKRLDGQTFEEIGKLHGLTRVRVRILIIDAVSKVRSFYKNLTNEDLFDEDYYRYFYGNYKFNYKECSEWFGVEPYVWIYLELSGTENGKAPLEDALKDIHNIDPALRLRIKNYLNRNNLYIDGEWVPGQRPELERIVLKKFCTDYVTVEEFVEIYNNFLRSEDIPYDPKLYCSEDSIPSLGNILGGSKFTLWVFGKKFRYYDIDAGDYTELLDTLNLTSYHNVELSTVKFVEAFPELMKKYDIRDGYELHSLLKKMLGSDGIPGMKFSKMPYIRFGTPHRDSDMFDIVAENAPISLSELCEIVHKEFGYDIKTIPQYVQHLMVYYHNGAFDISQKEMSEEKRSAFKSALTEDFYFLDEVRSIYREQFPDGDIEEVNALSLRKMGFLVKSNYIVQNYSNAKDYFIHILTCNDTADLTEIKNRYSSIEQFVLVYYNLQRELEIIKLDNKNIITIGKLEKEGFTKHDLIDFRCGVYDFVKDNEYFSIQSIRKAGFESDLFKLGFGDIFYASILLSDDRFSLVRLLGTIIAYKGKADITYRDFIASIVKREGMIGINELAGVLREEYGCKKISARDLMLITDDTDIFYNPELEKFYSDREKYYREIDET